MSKKNALELFDKTFEGMEVEIIQENEDILFELYSTGMALGQTIESKGKLYPRKERIDKNVLNAEISTVFRNGKQFLTEEMLYDLMLEMKTDKVKPFRKWVTSEVLPSLRKRGVYIMEHADEKVIDNEKLFGKRRIKNTFAKTEIHEVEKLYEDFLTYVTNQYTAKEKISMLQSVYNGLCELNISLSHDAVKNIGKCYDISLLQNRVLQDKAKYQNKRNGGIKGSQTKTINKLNPNIDEYTVFDIHPFSENSMYKAVNDYESGEPRLVRTDAYKRWLDNFPINQAIDKEDLSVDWTKPIKMFIKVDCLDKFDSSNFIKATNDMIMNRIYLEDDSIVKDTIISTNKIVDTYSEGKIYVYIQNI
jgi:prophage antirepressor-like protein